MKHDHAILAEAIPGLILQMNEDGIFIDVISKSEEILYKKKEEIIGSTIHEIMGPMGPMFFNLVQQTIKSNTPQNIEYEIPVLSGELMHFEGRCVPMDHTIDGRRCVIFIGRDITERKKTEEALVLSEQKFRSIYQNTNTGIAFADKTGATISANTAFLNILEYSEEELKKIAFYQLTHSDDIQLEMSLLKEILKGKRDQFQIEKRCITKTGRIIWADLNMAVIRHSNGSPNHFIAVITDISERKANEKLLSELISTKDKFFSIIAHDLQSPLSGIIGMCDLLKNNFDNMNEAQRTKALTELHAGSYNARILLKNVLEWSQSQSGQIIYTPELLQLKAIIENVLSLYSTQLSQKSITFNNHISQPIQVYSDANILHTVLRNLINNAIKYTHTNGHIYIQSEQKDGQYVISVKDTGVGIAEEVQQHLFRIDKKVSTPGTAKEKGTGLGLILCKELIDKYKGNIWVNSVVGEGTTFSFTIPEAGIS